MRGGPGTGASEPGGGAGAPAGRDRGGHGPAWELRRASRRGRAGVVVGRRPDVGMAKHGLTVAAARRSHCWTKICSVTECSGCAGSNPVRYADWIDSMSQLGGKRNTYDWLPTSGWSSAMAAIPPPVSCTTSTGELSACSSETFTCGSAGSADEADSVTTQVRHVVEIGWGNMYGSICTVGCWYRGSMSGDRGSGRGVPSGTV